MNRKKPSNRKTPPKRRPSKGKTQSKSAKKKELIKALLRAPVTGIRFKGETITFNFMGRRIADRILLKREVHVAEWSRRRKQIFIDRNISGFGRENSFRALCVHEAVEKFLAETYGLTVDNEAHVVATRKEREFLEKNGGNWRSHELVVYWDWHFLGEK